MGFRIQNNIEALNAQKNLNISSTAMGKSLQRLSSGYRINNASDDAAGLAVSQQFRADIASYKVASQNVSEANALLQVAEGSMDQVGNMLTRLKELATQASSANAGTNLNKINAEGNQLLLEIDRIANSTAYAGTKLVDGTFGVTVSSGGTFNNAAGFEAASGLQDSVTYSVVVATSGGANVFDITVSATLSSGQQVSQTIYNVDAPDVASNETAEVSFAALGLSLTLNDNIALNAGATVIANAGTAADFQVGAKDSANDRIGITLTSLKAADLDAGLVSGQMMSATNAQAFLTTVDDAISMLNGMRGDVGAAQNRLGYARANLATTVENYTAAESTIRDVDMASEMTNFTKNQILVQAGTAMLAQANASSQQVLSLFK
ncbi:MAG: flagellin [Deltaproteobacteria bacterium]|nr:flagellin [Deltaproteobacteria bacterium]